MTPLENIERVAHRSSADVARILLQQRPVILTGLFEGQPIADIASAEEAVARLGDLPLRIRPEYSFNGFQHFWHDGPASETEMTLAEYMNFKQRHADTPMLCLEQPTPEAVASLFSLGELAKLNIEDGDRIDSRFFLGNAGNKSNLHYDRDYRGILLHQVFGRKRVILIAPRESQKLRPVTNFSEYLLTNFCDEDKAAFIRYTNAWDAMLYPGETLVIPAAFWHHIEYVDDSMSFNVKLRRNRYLTLLGGGLFHSNYLVQGLVTKFVWGEAVAEKHGAFFDALLERYADSSLTPLERFEAIDALFRAHYKTVCADFPQERYFAPIVGTKESDLWREQLETGSLYGATGAQKPGAPSP